MHIFWLPPPNSKGFSLVETLLAIAIVTMVTAAASAMLVSGLKYNKVMFDQLTSQADGRRAMVQIVDDIRRADQSSVGAYPIAAASSTEFIFYANIDNQSDRERVRYTLTASTVNKGIIKPSGSPLQYLSSNEKVTTIANYVVNTTSSLPLFLYYTGNYAGTSTPMAAPITTTLIRLIGVQIKIDKNPSSSPISVTVNGTAEIRSLKDN